MNTLIFILLIAVLLVLLTGIALMARGGKLNQKYSNRLMTLRVTLQGVIILLLGFMFMAKH